MNFLMMRTAEVLPSPPEEAVCQNKSYFVIDVSARGRV